MPPARVKPQQISPGGMPGSPVVSGAPIYTPDEQETGVYTRDDVRAHGIEMAKTAIFETTLWYFVQQAQKHGEPTVMINGLYAIMEHFGFVTRGEQEAQPDAQ